MKRPGLDESIISDLEAEEGSARDAMRFTSINSDVDMDSDGGYGGPLQPRLISKIQPPVRSWNKARVLVCTGLCMLLLVGIGVIVWTVYFQRTTSPIPPHIVPVTDTFSLDGFVLNGTVNPETIQTRWSLTKDVLYRRDDEGSIWRLDGAASTLLVASASMTYAGTALNVFDYEVVPDETLVVLFANKQGGWRHSFTAEYYVIDVDSKAVAPVTGTVESLQFLSVSPRSNDPVAAFVRQDRVFVVSLASQQYVEVDTDPNFEFHGIPDWSYEEEVLETNNALYWAPGGTKLAFMSFDTLAVPNYSFPLYDGSAYPGQVEYKYPSPGYGNAVAAVSIYDLFSGSVASVDLNADGLVPSNRYIVQAVWASEELLAVRTLNRGQNVSTLMIASAALTPLPASLAGRVTLVQHSDTWIDVTKALKFYALSGSHYFVDLLPHQGYMSIAIYKLGYPSIFQRWATMGDYDVVSVDSVNVAVTPGVVAYTAASSPIGIPSPLDRTPWITSLGTEDPVALVSAQGYFMISYGPLGTMFKLTSAGPDAPTQRLYSLDPTHYPVTTSMQQTLTENKKLQSHLEAYGVPLRTFLDVPSAVEGEFNNAFMILPPGLDPQAATFSTNYPVLMYVYGGPGSQTVTRRYPVWGTRSKWHLYLASRGYIVVSVDGRGTGARGQEFLHSNYLNLGSHEVEDQLAAAEYLATLPYVDESKIGLWGWSYGGYMTTKTLTNPASSILKMGMAVAPVTDWHFYDSIYTERYMRTPAENPGGYQTSSVVNFASAIESDKLLLVHGSGDDNVHFTNSMELMKQMIQNQVLFDLMVYPNQAHSLSGGGAEQHVWRTLTRQVGQALGMPVSVPPTA